MAFQAEFLSVLPEMVGIHLKSIKKYFEDFSPKLLTQAQISNEVVRLYFLDQITHCG